MNFTASLEFTKLKRTFSDMLTATVGGLLWKTQRSFRYLAGHRRSSAGALASATTPGCVVVFVTTISCGAAKK
jgi:hypothetical protein